MAGYTSVSLVLCIIICCVLSSPLVVNDIHAQQTNNYESKILKIGIIGAGVAGLVSAKYAIENGYDVVVFEQTDNFGGTWRYTDATGTDEFGIPVHSAMYKNLTSNVPKEIMGLSDIEFESTNKSYITQEFFLGYIESYVEKFNLLSHIKFRNYVEDVRRTEDEKWSMTVHELEKQKRTTYIFDTIIACNGHYFAQHWPNIQGMEDFKGRQMHSHDYRGADLFKNKVVGIVGTGPSGVDIAEQLSNVAKKVIVSSKEKRWPMPKANNVISKPVIVKLNEEGFYFADNTFEPIDGIIYCTGYNYDFPFFKNDTGIKLENNWIKYLHRHIINVEHPSMAIILVPLNIFSIPLIEFSVKYYMAYLSKKFELPPKEEMISGLLQEQERRIALGVTKNFHYLLDNAYALVKDMSEEANIKPIPNVFFKIFRSIFGRNTEDIFKIIDNETFIKI